MDRILTGEALEKSDRRKMKKEAPHDLIRWGLGENETEDEAEDTSD